MRASASLRNRVHALAQGRAREQRALNEVADLRVALTARGGRLETMRAILDESRRLRRELARELGKRTEALAAGEAEAMRLQVETDALRAAVAERDSQASLLVAEESELAAAVAALEDEANRAGEEARRNASLAEDHQRCSPRESRQRPARRRSSSLRGAVGRGGDGACGTAIPAVCQAAHEVARPLAARLLGHAPAPGRLERPSAVSAAPPLRHLLC